MTPTILYQDDSFLVINKPSGMIVNKADTTRYETTVQDWLELKYGVQTSEEEHDFYKRAGIVHRLDKETSGVLIIAKTKESFENLQKQFKERVVKKTYLAMSHGKVTPEKGEINATIGRLPWNRKRFGVLPEGRESLTRYQVLRGYQLGSQQVSLVELYPETGRTHQIRVHLKHIGFPIVSDELYAGRKTARNDRKIISRLFLHAAKISFLHPTTGERVEFESPLPEDLATSLFELKAIDL